MHTAEKGRMSGMTCKKGIQTGHRKKTLLTNPKIQ